MHDGVDGFLRLGLFDDAPVLADLRGARVVFYVVTRDDDLIRRGPGDGGQQEE